MSKDDDLQASSTDGALSVECEEIISATYRLISYLDLCADRLKNQQLVDLSEIEIQVLDLCERTSLLPKHEAVILIAPLNELMAKMEDVSRILAEKQEELQALSLQKEKEISSGTGVEGQ